MDCERCREALSARMDGEAEPVPVPETDQHLEECAECRAWHEEVGALNRRMRVRPVRPGSGLSDAAMAQVLASARAPRRGMGWRIALAAVGCAQLVLGAAQVAGWDAGMLSAVPGGPHTSVHLFNESTSWNLALGLGMVCVAWRQRSAAGLLPVFALFLLMLTAYCVHDLIVTDVTPMRVLSHGLLVAGFILMLVVHSHHRRRDHPTAGDGHASERPAGSGLPTWTQPRGSRSARSDRRTWPVSRDDAA